MTKGSRTDHINERFVERKDIALMEHRVMHWNPGGFAVKRCTDRAKVAEIYIFNSVVNGGIERAFRLRRVGMPKVSAR